MRHYCNVLALFFGTLILAGPLCARQDGYVLAPSVWPNLEIPVCWENPSAANQTERQWVRDAVERSWETHSEVDFNGWGSCPNGTFAGVRIRVADEGAHVKRLGRYLAGVRDGMVLNFTFNYWNSGCSPTREQCIRSIAVHEFGHALGFAHEQNRPDTPAWCNQEQGSDGNVLVGNWDSASVMNYCNAVYNNNGVLSPTDIATVQLFYGARFSSPKIWVNSYGIGAGGW
ncbi:M12 family metallopeptidase, partial [Ruegeria arenilitoris]|uniref:M12 family metallopeptidase n=1 Tax=Ruegeria arenilitoris TaxID=1173585 RepID=UPI001C2BF783